MKTDDQQYNIQSNKSQPPTLITHQKQILQEYPDIFEGIGKFMGPLYHIQVDPRSHQNKHHADPYWSTSKMHSRKKLTRCYKPVFYFQ